MDVGWMLLATCVALGGEGRLKGNAFDTVPLKPLQAEFDGPPDVSQFQEANPPGIHSLHFIFLQAPQVGPWSPWQLRKAHPQWALVLRSLRNAPRFLDHLLDHLPNEWVERVNAALEIALFLSKNQPSLTSLIAQQTGIDLGKFRAASDILEDTLGSCWAMQVRMKVAGNAGNYDVKCESPAGASSSRNWKVSASNFRFECVRAFSYQLVGKAQTRTFRRRFSGQGKGTELECVEGKVKFEIVAEDWKRLTRKVGDKEEVLYSSGKREPVRYPGTLTLRCTPTGDWYYMKLKFAGVSTGQGWRKVPAEDWSGEREAWPHLTVLDEEYWLRWSRFR